MPCPARSGPSSARPRCSATSVAVDEVDARRGAMSSMRPSTYAGTPVTIDRGGVPRRSGHQPATGRGRRDPAGRDDDGLRAELELADTLPAGGLAPRRSSAASTSPRRPWRCPADRTSSSTRWRGWKVSRPVRSRLVRRADEGLDDARAGAPRDVEARDGLAVPVGPQVAPFGPADDRGEGDAAADEPAALLAGGPLDVRAGPLHRPPVLVVERSNCALPCQSLQASSKESFTPRRRCSGLSTRNRPPKDQKAWPPRSFGPSWSTRATVCRRR
jgi:hypothetical protein